MTPEERETKLIELEESLSSLLEVATKRKDDRFEAIESDVGGLLAEVKRHRDEAQAAIYAIRSAEATKAAVSGTFESLSAALNKAAGVQFEALLKGFRAEFGGIVSALKERETQVSVEAAIVDLSPISQGVSDLAENLPTPLVTVNNTITIGPELIPFLDAWMPLLLEAVTKITLLPKRTVKFTDFNRRGEPTAATIE